MSDYADLNGLIQFPVEPKTITVNDEAKSVREAVIKALNKDDKLVRCTFWDNYKHVPLKQGDYIIVGGKASTNQGKPKDDGTSVTYYNLSVTRVAVVEGAVPSDTAQTVNTKAPADANDVF